MADIYRNNTYRVTITYGTNSYEEKAHTAAEFYGDQDLRRAYHFMREEFNDLRYHSADSKHSLHAKARFEKYNEYLGRFEFLTNAYLHVFAAGHMSYLNYLSLFATNPDNENVSCEIWNGKEA